MPRTARIVIPDVPHHIIQRGNRRQDVFFGEEDYLMYLSLLRDLCHAHGVAVHAYCLMKNHLHLIVVPPQGKDFRVIGEVNRRYACYLNRKMQWTGFLWQGRFASYPMDERYAYEAVRYVELNPVRADICTHPAQYRWSSARQRIGKFSERDLKIAPANFLGVHDWEGYWAEALDTHASELFSDHERSQKPLGFVALAA